MAQAREHLELANEAKLAAGEMRAKLRRRDVLLAEVLDHPLLQGYRLGKVLNWLPRYGAARVDRTLATVGISPARLERPVRTLTARQKAALAAVVEERYAKNVAKRAQRNGTR